MVTNLKTSSVGSQRSMFCEEVGTSVDIQHVGPTTMQKLLDRKPKVIITQL